MPLGRAPKRMSGSAFRSECSWGHSPGASLARLLAAAELGKMGQVEAWAAPAAASESTAARAAPARRERIIIGVLAPKERVTIAKLDGGGKARRRRR